MYRWDGSFDFKRREDWDYKHSFNFMAGWLGQDETKEAQRRKKKMGTVDEQAPPLPKDDSLVETIEKTAKHVHKSNDPTVFEHLVQEKNKGRSGWDFLREGGEGRDYYLFCLHCCEREVDPRPMALHARKVKEDRELKQVHRCSQHFPVILIIFTLNFFIIPWSFHPIFPMVEPPSPGGATGAGHRGAYFAALLASSDALRLTSGTEGLGLALRRAASTAEEIYRGRALAVHRHDARCEEVEAICKARPCFLPPSCYCAALSSLLQSTAESDLLHSLLSLSKPDRIARRAPGISSGDTGPCDITAREILRQSDLAEDLLPLYSDLARIWKYNAFDTGDGRMAIFLLPSLCNHSCLPAAEYTLCDDDGTVEMLLFSLRDLEAGDPLTICYIENNEKHRSSRMARRNTLAEGWLSVQIWNLESCNPRPDAPAGFAKLLCRPLCWMSLARTRGKILLEVLQENHGEPGGEGETLACQDRLLGQCLGFALWGASQGSSAATSEASKRMSLLSSERLTCPWCTI
ncbi:unnamed protein product [Cladocopium goreaui]|uniref:WW domain-containing protein n=1 Tax=Cladocopium goreaui TaxID=2562237 RepID=A0A9P1D0V9_9DINO|nr:unnamed protein product [Cladocopium goreaui]